MSREGSVVSGRKLGMRCSLIFSFILSLIYTTNKYLVEILILKPILIYVEPLFTHLINESIAII